MNDVPPYEYVSKQKGFSVHTIGTVTYSETTDNETYEVSYEIIGTYGTYKTGRYFESVQNNLALANTHVSL